MLDDGDAVTNTDVTNSGGMRLNCDGSEADNVSYVSRVCVPVAISPNSMFV